MSRREYRQRGLQITWSHGDHVNPMTAYLEIPRIEVICSLYGQSAREALQFHDVSEYC